MIWSLSLLPRVFFTYKIDIFDAQPLRKFDISNFYFCLTQNFGQNEIFSPGGDKMSQFFLHFLVQKLFSYLGFMTHKVLLLDNAASCFSKMASLASFFVQKCCLRNYRKMIVVLASANLERKNKSLNHFIFKISSKRLYV